MSSNAAANVRGSGTGIVPSSSLTRDMYLYDMPPTEREDLCSLLDDLNIWHDLAVKMQYRSSDLLSLKRAVQGGRSPSNELLLMWGTLNHTVTELFILLFQMKQYTAMEIIRNLVDSKYHRYIMSGRPAISILLSSNNGENKSKKLLNCNSSQIVSNSNNADFTSTSSYDDESNENSNIKKLDTKAVKKLASAIPHINYRELVEATAEWNPNNILGSGGFATVFKGEWKFTAIAIKRIKYRGTLSKEVYKIDFQQSMNELKYLNSCRHDNILPLYGYSINGEFPCLIYQLMTGGSLEQRLTSKEVPLKCEERLNIARGTARGLQYLHTFREKPLIHGDIKPANILLDPCNQPKIGDFGLAREGPDPLDSSMEVSCIFGTRPYLPPEFISRKTLSVKVDTYSFGVVLLELVTGLRAYEKNRKHQYLTRHIIEMRDENVTMDKMMDKTIPNAPHTMTICQNMINTGLRCISEKHKDRPEMLEVYNELKQIGS